MALTGDFVDVTPDPRNTVVPSIQIVFSQSAKGVTLGAFRLTRDGVNVPLAAPGQSVTGSGTTWTLNGLSSPTSIGGVYVVSIPTPGSGIEANADSSPLSGNPSDTWSQIEPWPGVTSCFRSAHLFHQSGMPFKVGSTYWGGALAPLALANLTYNAGTYVGTLTADYPTDQDWSPGDWISVEGQMGATTNGLWRINTVNRAARQFTLVPPPDGPSGTGTGLGGTGTRWHPARWDSLGTFMVCAAGERGYERGTNGYDKNFLVPSPLTLGIRTVSSAGEGTPYGSLVKVRLFVPGHTFVNGDIVEVSGVRQSDGSEIAKGCWVVGNQVAGFSIDLEKSIWPDPSVTSIANTGIVRLHYTDAVLNRTYLMTGGPNNGFATTPITDMTQLLAQDRGYQQGMDSFRAWFEGKSRGKRGGYYFSASAVGTPYSNLERGINAAYPMFLTPIDKDFTNGWEINTTQPYNINYLEVTVLGARVPQGDWPGKVRVALIGHSNPSYCLDPYLDETDSVAVTGGSGLRRLNGFSGAATAGSTTTLTAGLTFPNWLVGCELYMESGSNAGKTQTIKKVSGNTITVANAFAAPILAGTLFRAGHLGYPVTSVDSFNQKIQLAAPYRAFNGTGGVLIVMGNLSNNVMTPSITQGGAKPGGGFYTKVTTETAHGLAVGDYLTIFGVQLVGGLNVNCNKGVAVDGLDGVAVHRVVSVDPVNHNMCDIDRTYSGSGGSLGRWYGTCLSLIPANTTGSLGEAVDEGRMDIPDFRHVDVKSMFATKQRAMITTAFTRHTARNIGFLDEAAFRYKASPASDVLAVAPLESTDQTIARIGDLGDWLRTTYLRRMTVNVTCPLTRDTFSVPQRTDVINRWGGLMSEGACFLHDRSAYQMGGTDGYLGHISALLTNNARYYYAPQDVGDENEGVSKATISASVANGNATKLTVAASLLPTKVESDNEVAPTPIPHNHSGSMVGIYNHSIAALNGVFRVRSQQAGNGVTIEAAAQATSGSSGTMVYSHFAAPVKTTGVTAITDGLRVTTEMPHNIPDAADEITRVRIFNYSGFDETLTYPVKRTTDYEFELSFLEFEPPVRPTPPTQLNKVGICFFTRADLWHWLGLSYMLWQPGKALEYSSGSTALSVNTKRAYLPAGLTADGAYVATTSITGSLTGKDTGFPRSVLKTNVGSFTDAVLNEPVLIISATNVGNVGQFRRIKSYTGSNLTVDADFPADLMAADTFEIGRINTLATTPYKILQLHRTFNGGTRRVEVYPHKCAVKYTGF